jgi:hypothetical protein
MSYEFIEQYDALKTRKDIPYKTTLLTKIVMEAKIHGDEVYLPAKKNRNKELDYKHINRDFAKI